MPIEFYDARAGRGSTPFVSVDRFGRLCLSRATCEMLGCVDSAIKLYVGYDKVNKRIALAKPDVVRLVDKNPLTFDRQRHYASARRFFEMFQIPYDKSYRYIYVGKEDGIYLFELEGYDAPDAQYQPEVQERKQRGGKDA